MYPLVNGWTKRVVFEGSSHDRNKGMVLLARSLTCGQEHKRDMGCGVVKRGIGRFVSSI
jgi:hypothetical protein